MIINGEKMPLIGRGSFTKAYLSSSNEVYLSTTDPIKEVMALGWFPEHRLFPRVTIAEGGIYFKMPFYAKVRSLKNNLEPDEYQLYKELRQLFTDSNALRNIYDSYGYWYEVFESASLSHPEAEEIKEALLGALDACSNIDSTCSFEISPRNVAVSNGKLILLDTFYSIKELRKSRC